MRAAIVWYRGERWKIKPLATAFGITLSVFKDRWEEWGRPEIITEEIALDMRTPRKFSNIKYQGKVVAKYKLARRFGVPELVITRLVRKYGHNLLPEHLSDPIAAGAVEHQAAHPIEYKENREPGWLERREFPNAGKNGFCKQERGVGAGFVSNQDAANFNRGR